MLEHWLWLAHRPGINEHTKVLLLQYFGSPEGVYTAADCELTEIPGLTGAGRKSLADKSMEQYEAALMRCRRENIRILTYLDEEYPRRLKNIYNPPLVLYYKGTLPKFDGYPTIGVVGTRRCSAYGVSVAEKLGGEISSCGGTVVSGLADGIDAAAMSGALRVGCPTVGVLGTGADIVYPAVNRALFAQVERCGCLLSEFLPGTGAFKYNFPKRNRIMAGLSCGVLVVEAPQKSGSLITARQALEQGRDVFVVPGNVDLEGFQGSYQLLRDGAIPAGDGWEVVGEYADRFPGKVRKVLFRPEHPVPEEALSTPKTAVPKVAQKPRIPREKTTHQGEADKKAIDKGVVFVSGKTFDPHGQANNYMRLSYCNTSVDKINKGIPLVASAIKEVLAAHKYK